MKTRQMNMRDRELFQTAQGYPRIIACNNKFEWSNVGSYKGNIRIELTIRPLSYTGEPVFKEKNNVEQFGVTLNQAQTRELIKQLEDRLKAIKKNKRYIQ